jgi:AraC-like DNA-binding protein
MTAVETIIPWRRPGGLVDRVGHLRGKTGAIDRRFVHTSLSVILDGAGRLRRGTGPDVPIHAPAVFCCRPGEDWRYRPEPRWDEVFAVFTVPPAALAARLGVVVPDADWWRPADPAGLGRLADLLTAGCSPLQAGHGLVVDRLAEALFALACQTAGADDDPAVARAAAWMHARLASPLRIAAAAAVAGLSPAQFRRRFQARYGASPLAWLNRERLRRAEALLAEGRSMAEAGRAVGIHDRRWLQRLRRRG